MKSKHTPKPTESESTEIRQTVVLAPVLGSKCDAYIKAQRELGRRLSRNDVITEALIAFFATNKTACIQARSEG